MLHVSGCVFDSVVNYSAGLLRLTEVNLAFFFFVLLMSECVWRASNHGDQHGHWHDDGAQQRPGAQRIP